MNCPRCNATVAFKKNRCDNCGQDLKNYRRIVSLSNIYYNKALSQAKIRDLTGAISSLKQSLQFNKLNTSARNLLGLIYYEEGEIVSALSEWVISKHFQANNNDADMYINEIQSNPNKLEMHSQTIKKYNSALFSAQHGDEDMAIIQLKKVVNLNPKFIRANQLLALLYMMTGKRENRVRAMKLLKNIIKVDVTNTTTLRYMQELSDVHLKSEPVVVKSEQKDPGVRKKLPRVEADPYKKITPYKEERPSILPFINVLVGVIIGLALMYCLIIPHMKSNEANSANEDFKKYSENQAAADSDTTTLKNQNETLQARVDELESELETLQGSSSTQGGTLLDVYDSIFIAVNSYMDDDMEEAAESLLGIDKESLKSDAAKKIYKKVSETTFKEASNNIYIQGRDAYNGENEYAGARDYDKAIELLELSLEYNPDNTDAMYFLGRSYQQLSKPKKAKEYYEKIINDYPDSDRVSEASSRLRELGE